MTDLSIILRSLKVRLFSTLVTVVSVAIAVGLLMALLMLGTFICLKTMSRFAESNVLKVSANDIKTFSRSLIFHFVIFQVGEA